MAQKPASYKIMNHDMAKSAYKAGSQNLVLGITHWLLISLILTLGFGQLLRFEISGIPIFVHDILILATLLVQSWNLWSKSKIGKVNFGIIKPYLGLSIFTIGILIGFIRALTLYPISHLALPSLYACRILAYIALFLILKIQKIKIPLSIFYLSGMVTIVIGLHQYLYMPDMRVFQNLGWDDHLSRLTLPHFDPTFTGVMIGLFGLTLINSKYVYKVTLLILSSVAIMLTYSRSVWASLLITSFMFIKNKILLLLCIPVVLLSALALPQKFGEGTNLLRTFSISSRMEHDISYIQDYGWDLITGKGMNTSILNSRDSERPNHATGPNNSYLYILTTTGVLGLIGWGMFLFSLYRHSAYKPMLLFFFAASLFNNVMFYPFALLWVMLIESQSLT